MPFEEATQFNDAGYNRLPDEVAGKPFTDAFEVSVLVYEYAQLRLDGENEIVRRSRYDGRTHLELAGILGELALSHACDGTVHP